MFNRTTGTRLAKSRPEDSTGPITHVLSHQDVEKETLGSNTQTETQEGRVLKKEQAKL